MQLLTEADKGNWHDYSLWEIFKSVRFYGEVIQCIIAVESKVSTKHTELCKVNCQY